MKLNYQSKNQGLTLIEALIWFALFAAVVAGVFALYSNSRNASNISTINKELSVIFSTTESLFATEDVSQITNLMAYKLGIFPKSLKISNNGSTVKNILGGDVTIYGNGVSSFTVTYNGIPSGSICASIIRGQKSIGWESVNGMYYFEFSSVELATTLCGPDGMGTLDLAFTRGVDYN